MEKAGSAFDEDLFEVRLELLKDSQEGIQQMSTWCMQQRMNHKKIISSWLNVFKRVSVEQRLTLFYLANDVVQYSKRKGYEFVEGWATAIQRATTMVRDEKVKNKILRIFKIWEQRGIYTEDYLTDLRGLLNMKPAKKAVPEAESNDDFQDAVLISNIRECVELSTLTDKSFKKLPKPPNCDIESVKQQLKDKTHSVEVQNEIARYISYIEAFNKHMHDEIKSRKALITNLNGAVKFFTNQRGDVKVVLSAYKSFGNRIKNVKKKLDEITPNLASPIPSPDINAPSPEPDTDLQLPDDQSSISVNMFKNNINGYSSYMDGKLPFDINDFKREESSTKTPSQPIEVIGSRSDDDSFNSNADFYKPETISVYSSTSNVVIPGLNNPMPVPPVQTEYTSLARSSQQYNTILPPPNPPIFSSINSGYSNLISGYNYPNNNENSSYNNNRTNTTTGSNLPPLMPPPPMPALSNIGGGGGGGVVDAQPNPEFNSSWDMNMAWSNVNNSTTDNDVAAPNFERETLNINSSSIEYSERNNSLGAAQDVDHRPLHLPAPFNNSGNKIGLAKDKSRQLDIDHRNLISLTGSPGSNDRAKKSWLSPQDQDLRVYSVSDVNLRNEKAEVIQTIDILTTPKNSTDKGNISSSSSTLMAPPLPTSGKKHQKNNANMFETQKDDSSTRYDPSDMVVDMDMSDEDLDDIVRAAQEDEQEIHNDESQSGGLCDDTAPLLEDQLTDETETDGSRPALLETPTDYSQNIWDNPPINQMSVPANFTSGEDMQSGMDMQFQQPWNQQMQWNERSATVGNEMIVPPPPRPPFPFQFPYNNEHGRGRGRGWSPQTHFRNVRGARGSPYFMRGARGGGFGSRGGFRGKFRGNNSWI